MEKGFSIEEMVKEMIHFLKTWGLWENTRIFACGNAYDSEERGLDYAKCREMEGFTKVYIAENINPNEYVESPVEEGEPFEHIFDMTFESSLCDLLDEGILRVEYSEIESRGWDYIFDNNSWVEEWLEKEYPDGEELLSHIISEDGEDSGFTMWDPLRYDDYDELEEKADSGMLKMVDDPGKKEQSLIPAYTLFDNYEDYEKFLNGDYSLIRKDSMLWQMTKRFLAKCFLGEYAGDEVEIKGEIADHIIHEFHEIFRKYGMWYEPMYAWMIVGYIDTCNN